MTTPLYPAPASAQQDSPKREVVAYYRDIRKYLEWENSAKEDHEGYMAREWWHVSAHGPKNMTPPDNEGWIAVCRCDALPAQAGTDELPPQECVECRTWKMYKSIKSLPHADKELIEKWIHSRDTSLPPEPTK